VREGLYWQKKGEVGGFRNRSLNGLFLKEREREKEKKRER
jgi:hypothetical protein